MKKTRVLVTGVNGQDGSYAAEILIKSGIEVIGLTRNRGHGVNLRNVADSINFTIYQTDYTRESLSEIVVSNQITHILNFAGQSYVGLSWTYLEDTIKSQAADVGVFLSIIRESSNTTRFINASSSEVFSPREGSISTRSNRQACNPYGVAQKAGSDLVDVYREYEGVWALNVYMFPHESVRRDKNFLFPALAKRVIDVKDGISSDILVGSGEVVRDWGFAPEFVYNTVLAAFGETPKDILLCTGQGTSVKELAEIFIRNAGLDCANVLIREDASLMRAYDHKSVVGDPSEFAELKMGGKIIPRMLSDFGDSMIRRMLCDTSNERSLDDVSEYFGDELFEYVYERSNILR